MPATALASLVVLTFLRPSLRAEDRPVRQIVDREVRAAWHQHHLTPAGRADDATFLRRVTLDLIGTIPTREEAVRFLADGSADRREKLIDRLLADPRFASGQANVWDLVLFGRNPPNLEADRKREGFKKWLSGQLARNEPYDRWVRALLLGEQPGTELFYVQHRGRPEEAAVAVSRIFLGVQLQCARCHDHPYESWTQRDFYGMAGFFVRLVVIDKQGSGQPRYALGEKSSGEVLFTGAVKDQKPGQKGEPIKPRFPGGPVLDEPPLPRGFKEPRLQPGKPPPQPVFSRKEKLAAWVTAADNPYLARAVVNRVWAQLLGKGLVHPVDDLSDKNPPSHPELLEALAEGLKAHRFDLKWLIRELVNSDTYQLAAEGPTKDALPPWYERARVRPLSAEELLAAFCTATGFDASGQKLGGDTIEYFLRYFGAPTNGRGEFQGGLSEHLFLNNSEQLKRMIQRRKGNLADRMLASTEPWERRVDGLFLSVLSRPPTTAERKKFVAYLTTPGARPEARVEEAIWVLLNTAEFRFNH